MIFKAREHLFDLSQKVLIMGVLNVTPDSFSDGGNFLDPKRALEQALLLEKNGADFLDLGAVSTRPGAESITPQKELERLLPVLDILKDNVSISLSIDTTSSEVALAALKRGVAVVNDVSGLKDDPELAAVVSDYKAGVVLMHRRGDAQDMQSQTTYNDVVCDVKRELDESIQIAKLAHIPLENIVLDPGIGFAKTYEQNIEILKRLEEFSEFKLPILLGTSRKSFLGQILNKEPQNRDYGTVASCLLGLQKGVRIFRVHNVEALRDAFKVFEAIDGNSVERRAFSV